MFYYENMYSRRKSECDMNTPNTKCKKFNNLNINKSNFNRGKLNVNDVNSDDGNNFNFNCLSKNKNDDGIDDWKTHEQHSVKASITDIYINESNPDYLNKVSCIENIKDNFFKENENIFQNCKSNENIKTNIIGGNTQDKKDCLQQSSGVYDKLRYKCHCKTHMDFSNVDDINNYGKLREDSDKTISRIKPITKNFLEMEIDEEFISNEKKISDKLSVTKFHNKCQDENAIFKKDVLKDFSNQLIELNNINNKKLSIEDESFFSQKVIEENKNNSDNSNLFRSDDKDLRNIQSHYVSKTDHSMHNDKRFSISKNFDDSKIPMGISFGN